MATHVDFKRTLKDLYSATQTVRRVSPEMASFLSVDGHGEPGGPAFQVAVQRLYSVAYTLKFSLKKAAVVDFAIPPLEALWYDDPDRVSMSEWRWRIMLRIPDDVTQEQVDIGKHAVTAKGGEPSVVQLVRWREGPCLQTLHVGPYGQVTEAYERLASSANEQGLTLTGPGHETYLSDPRRTAPEKLKTIVRMPMAAA